MIFYFIGNSLGPSGVATCGEVIRGSVSDCMRLVYLNSKTSTMAADDESIYIPIGESHKVNYICQKILDSATECSQSIIIVPNNSTVAYEVAFTLLSLKSQGCLPKLQISVVAIIHSNIESSISLVTKSSFFISGIISVSKEIYKKTELLIANGLPHIPLLPPNRFRGETKPVSRERVLLNVVYIGRLDEEQKRLSRLMEVIDMLADWNVTLAIDFYGSGALYDQLMRQKQRLDSAVASVRLRVYGMVSHTQVEEILARADVLVLTSDFEGSPLVILEAMSKGVVPVVMHYGREVEELIENGVNGIVVAQGDVSAMASVLSELSQDLVHLNEMKSSALEASDGRPSGADWCEALTLMGRRKVGPLLSSDTEFREWVSLARAKLRSLSSQTKIAIWGAGELGRTIIDLIKEEFLELKVIVIVDKSLFQYLKQYSEIPVVSPTEILLYQIDEIIVASRYYATEISREISELYAQTSSKPVASRPFAVEA